MMEGTTGIALKLASARRHRLVVLACLGAALVAVTLLAISIGAAGVPLSTSARILGSRMPLLGRSISHTWDPTVETIIISVRLPRVVLALLVGMALALAGTIFQGLFRNPMADPGIVGSSQGGALGATLAFFFGIEFYWGGLSAVPLFAFAGALGAVLLLYLLARTGGTVPVTSLLLVGFALSSFIASIVTLLMVVSKDRLPNIFFWLMGGLGTSNWSRVTAILPFIVAGIAISVFFTRDLNLMLLGEARAAQLGLSVERTKLLMLMTASLLVGAAVSVSGIIGFVGLMTPHIVRLLTGPDHRYLVPGSLLGGGLFLVLADLLARTVIAPNELPVGIVTAFFGAPFFIYLLRSKRGRTTAL
ncbi:MAG: FecCD family ABC transporter permease [Candidatus Geothermincolia bacterium]